MQYHIIAPELLNNTLWKQETSRLYKFTIPGAKMEILAVSANHSRLQPKDNLLYWVCQSKPELNVNKSFHHFCLLCLTFPLFFFLLRAETDKG